MRTYKGKPTKAEQKKLKLERRAREIWRAFQSQGGEKKFGYKYPSISPAEARARDINVYWTKCKYGHIEERKVDGTCPICETVSRTHRAARKRGAPNESLSKIESLELKKIYDQARQLSAETGTPHHVDHIVPLAAGGRHHPANLQVLTAEENLRKGAKYKGKVKRYNRKERRQFREEYERKLRQQKIEEYRSAQRLSALKGFAVYCGSILLVIAIYLYIQP